MCPRILRKATFPPTDARPLPMRFHDAPMRSPLDPPVLVPAPRPDVCSGPPVSRTPAQAMQTQQQIPCQSYAETTLVHGPTLGCASSVVRPQPAHPHLPNPTRRRPLVVLPQLRPDRFSPHPASISRPMRQPPAAVGQLQFARPLQMHPQARQWCHRLLREPLMYVGCELRQSLSTRA